LFIEMGVLGTPDVPIGAQADKIKARVNNEKINIFLMLIGPLEIWNGSSLYGISYSPTSAD